MINLFGNEEEKETAEHLLIFTANQFMHCLLCTKHLSRSQFMYEIIKQLQWSAMEIEILANKKVDLLSNEECENACSKRFRLREILFSISQCPMWL